MEERIWRIRTVCANTGLSRGMVYALIAKGEFPTQVQLGERAVGWLASEITDWISSRPRNDRPAA